MGPYSAARPQYLLLPELPPPPGAKYLILLALKKSACIYVTQSRDDSHVKDSQFEILTPLSGNF